MLKIARVALPKEQLQKLTAAERSLFLLLGHGARRAAAPPERAAFLTVGADAGSLLPSARATLEVNGGK